MAATARPAHARGVLFFRADIGTRVHQKSATRWTVLLQRSHTGQNQKKQRKRNFNRKGEKLLSKDGKKRNNCRRKRSTWLKNFVKRNCEKKKR